MLVARGLYNEKIDAELANRNNLNVAVLQSGPQNACCAKGVEHNG